MDRRSGSSRRGLAGALLAPLLGCLLCCVLGCTVVKPVVCTFTYPIDVMSASAAVPEDDDEDDSQDIPPTLVCLAAPILIPLRFLGHAVMGFSAGLVSGFASDLNVITWNCESPAANLTRPFRTNARKTED